MTEGAPILRQVKNICLTAVVAQSVQRWATGWTIGVLGFDSRRWLGIFLFTTASRTALVPTQPPIQWVLVDVSLRVKRPWREADHSPPSGAEVKECVELYLHSQYAFMVWCLVKHRDNFTFTFNKICLYASGSHVGLMTRELCSSVVTSL
jgi:hypothetical protein